MTSVQELSTRYGTGTALAILALRVYHGTAGKDELTGFVKCNTIQWEQLTRCAIAHSLHLTIYGVLQQCTEIPEEYAARLKKQSLLTTTRNMDLLQEMVRLQQVFSAAGVEVLPCKGLPAGLLLEGSAFTRNTVDLDLLVLPENFPQVRLLLLKNGYLEKTYFHPSHRRYCMRLNSEACFEKTGSNGRLLKVELHWQILPRMLGNPLPNTLLFSNRQEVVINNCVLPAPGIPQHLLVLLAHHGVSDLWTSIKNMHDLAGYLRRHGANTPWQELAPVFKIYGMEKTVAAGFQLTENLLGVVSPFQPRQKKRSPGTVKDLENGMLQLPRFVLKKSSFRNMRRQWTLCDSSSRKLAMAYRYAVKVLTPSEQELRMVYFPPAFFFLYYLLKPLRLLGIRARRGN